MKEEIGGLRAGQGVANVKTIIMYTPKTNDFQRSLILTFCGFLLTTVSVCAQELPERQVLVLNSYQKGFLWSDNIVKGIESVLEPTKNNITLRIEYMDTKYVGYKKEYKKRLYDLYKYKYSNQAFDLVISTDDNAFDFLREYHKDLFPGVPIVFCGVNNLDAAKLIDRDIFTGIIELHSVRGTIDLMLGLHPETRRIVFIFDNTPTGTFLWSQIEGLLKHYKDIRVTRFDDSLSMNQVEDGVSKLSDDTVVLWGPFNRDKFGTYYSSEEGAFRISKASAQPVYGLSVQVLPYGIVGGKLLGGFYHGQVTAKIAQRVLAGQAVRSIPVPERSPAQYMFNYEQLQRFGINISDLPEESVVINRPFSFYETSKKLVWSVVVVVLLQAVAILVMWISIIRRRQAEDALRESEAKYLQAQKMEAIGQLAGGIAHDFRNQLTVIRGYAEMLLRRSLGKEKSPEYLEYLEVIIEAADRSTALTGQLLAFSKKESLQPKVVDLNESMRDMSKLLPQMIGEDILLSVVPSPKACCANVDPRLLQQAIMNLVVNARHAMPDGGKLAIETGCVEMDREAPRPNPDTVAGLYALVAVSDTGDGMDAETLDKIFDPFYTTKEVGKGTGMGLAMVHGFVAQSDGFIQVDSEPGKGATFRLYFPLADCVETPTEVTSTSELGALPQGTETLLVVEDEEAVRHLTVSMLRECGYTVLEAGNSVEALPLGKHYEDRIDLLVTDVIMPNINGVELAEQLRSVRPGMAVLFISGYDKNVVAQSELLGPVVEMLTKPLDRMTLVWTVRRLLDKAKPTPS